MTALTPEQEARVREIAAEMAEKVMRETERLRLTEREDAIATATEWVIHRERNNG